MEAVYSTETLIFNYQISRYMLESIIFSANQWASLCMIKSTSSYSTHLRLELSALKPVNLTEGVRRFPQSLQDDGTTAYSRSWQLSSVFPDKLSHNNHKFDSNGKKRYEMPLKKPTNINFTAQQFKYWVIMKCDMLYTWNWEHNFTFMAPL
jgi:hypothetical protein